MGQSHLANCPIVQLDASVPAACACTEATGSFGIRATRAVRTSFTRLSLILAHNPAPTYSGGGLPFTRLP